VYFPLIQLLSSNYSNLSNQELEIFNQLKFIFVEYLYNPRHEPIDMNMLYSDFKDLGNLFRIKLMGKNKSFSLSRTLPNKTTSSSKKYSKSGGLKHQTRKNRGEGTNVSFERKPQQKRFKNPIFLSIK